jgi:ubiquinol-cytochrome c reductase core subunit 2
MSQKKFLASTEALALSSAHALAFHRGLGTPLHPSSSIALNKYLSAETIEDFAKSAYAQGNFAVVANGADHGELTKWVGEFFKGYSSTGSKLTSEQSKYYGGEERIAHGSGNTIVLGFSGSSSATGGFYKPEIAVLASLLGGQSSIKWSSGFSLLSKAGAAYPDASIKTKSAIYSDAGLLYVSINGSAKDVAGAAHEAVKTIKAIAGGQIAKEDIKKAIANAKFAELEYGQQTDAAIELTGAGLVHGGKAYQIDETAKAIDGVTEEKVKQVSLSSLLWFTGDTALIMIQAAKTLLEHKASVSSVGDLYVLPYAQELGLNV